MAERLEQLIATESNPHQLQDQILEISRIYAQVAGFNAEMILARIPDFEFWEAEYLGGEGITEWGMSTMDAFRCLIDIPRTTTLISGVRETVNYLKKTGKDKLIAIDAGTGTGFFAAYMTMIGVDKVYALEINPQSAEIAKNFINKLGLSDKVEVITCDATTVQLPTKGVDILFSENLSGGLFEEPQFQIINHLSEFLAPNAAIIPHSSELFISLGWANWNQTDKSDIAVRRINHKIVTPKMPFFQVASEVYMAPPIIKGVACLQIPEGTDINTIFISSRFVINKDGRKQVLEPDSANFLGKTSAHKLSQTAMPDSDGRITVSLEYPAGCSKSIIENSTSPGQIIFKHK